MMMRAMLGVLLGVIARVWLFTLRVHVELHPSLLTDEAAKRPWVLVFFHGKQWPLLAWSRRRKTTVMVSLSNDGALQTRALSILGFDVVRGSSSRGGARGLAAIVRRLKRGDRDAAFAVDGPRGPYGVVKPGALLAARRSNALVVPMGSAMTSGKVLHRAWDKFALAWPFSRVAITLGPVLEPPPIDVDALLVKEGIEAANLAAEAILARKVADMVPFSRFLPESANAKTGDDDL